MRRRKKETDASLRASVANTADISWDDAIALILSEAGKPLRYTEIADEISTRGMKSVANPAASVSTAFSRSLAGDDSPFIRLGGGQYTLKEQISVSHEAAPTSVEIAEPDTETGALRAFGMFWQRDAVIWSGKPRLLGRQSEGASDVDFTEQVGVYLLHDRDRVIYVGRASDTLFARLKSHTTDRLGGRWDRFSWFGLRSVYEDGSLAPPSSAWTHRVVIDTLEALLIESLEPPLNRKRGDNFSGAEYLQVADPEIRNREIKKQFEDFLKSKGI